ncbi:PE family protein, partial [Mycobacterium kansasii]|uniref:PE family protein n=1 Tax=Mycobacterium kansasii TaxID=1768 RepID=UPI000D43C2EC
MSYLVVGPELLASAATDLTRIEQAIGAANVAALPHTSELLAAGADEVSTAVAALFSGHARVYQAVSAQATAFHDRFVQAINGAGVSYAGAEAANVQQTLLDAINAPVQTLLGRPLIGDGVHGSAPGQAGGPGGLLYGNGGNGAAGMTPGVAGGAGGVAGLIGLLIAVGEPSDVT